MFFSNTTSHFIIASPRSGTTWMSKMLNAHPDVFCVERRLFGNYADMVLDEGAKTPRLRVTLDKYTNSLFQHHGFSDKAKKQLLKGFIKTLEKEEKKQSGKHIIVDKITPYVNTADIVIKKINSFFPKSKLIYLVRDGRDVLTSGVFHWFNKQSVNDTLTDFEKKRRAVFLNNTEEQLPRFFQDKEIQQWANEWVQPIKTIEKARKKHQVKIIFYEDLLANPEEVLKECLVFLSAKTPKITLDKCVEEGSFRNMSAGRKKGDAVQNAHVRKGVSGDWKNYFTYADGKLFQDIVGNALVEYGYETDDKWYEELR